MTAPKHRAEDQVFTRSWRLTEAQIDQSMDDLKGTFEVELWNALEAARLAPLDETEWTTQDAPPARGSLKKRPRFPQIDLIATVAVEPWTPDVRRGPGRRAA